MLMSNVIDTECVWKLREKKQQILFEVRSLVII